MIGFKERGMFKKHTYVVDESQTVDIINMIKINADVIDFIDSSSVNYDILCETAINTNATSIKYIDPTVSNYAELCEIAVKRNPNTIRYVVHPSNSNYAELCKIAVKRNPNNIMNIEDYIDIYNELYKIAIESDYYTEPVTEASDSYHKLMGVMIIKSPAIIEVLDKNDANYIPLCNRAAQLDCTAIKFIDNSIPEYVKICTNAIYNKPNAIEYVDNNIPEFVELCKLAISLNPYSVADYVIDEYDELIKLKEDTIKKYTE